MKAILLRRPGGPEALEYVEVPTPVPGEGKVLVKADTIGVSMPEVLVRRGTYAWMPALPAIPGIELSGTVVAHGPNTAEPALGQPVFVSARDLPAQRRLLCRIHRRAGASGTPLAARLLARGGGVPFELSGRLSRAAHCGARGRGETGARPHRGGVASAAPRCSWR